MVNITNRSVCVSVLVPESRTVTSPAQHLSSCQGDLHPLPEQWSETSQSMEQCRTKLRLAGKRPPALYHRRGTRADCQILSSREQGLRVSQETLQRWWIDEMRFSHASNFRCLPLDLDYMALVDIDSRSFIWRIYQVIVWSFHHWIMKKKIQL